MKPSDGMSHWQEDVGMKMEWTSMDNLFLPDILAIYQSPEVSAGVMKPSDGMSHWQEDVGMKMEWTSVDNLFLPDILAIYQSPEVSAGVMKPSDGMSHWQEDVGMKMEWTSVDNIFLPRYSCHLSVAGSLPATLRVLAPHRNLRAGGSGLQGRA